MIALIFGALHALVDAASLAVLYAEVPRERLSWGEIGSLIVCYNCVAFGLQLPLGVGLDRLRAYKPAAVAGLALTGLAVAICPCHAYLGAIVVGLGNALFHVGAGAIVLRHSEGRATGPGIFVAPGALGVTLGIWLGSAGFPYRWLQVIIFACAAVLVARWALPTERPVEAGRKSGRATVALCAALLFVSVAIRQLLGGTVAAEWRTAWEITLAVTLAAVAGKALGGVIADRLGWKVVAVGAMLLLAPLVGRAMYDLPLALEAVVLLQLTMAVTLAAMFRILPRHPAAAFGLLSLGLLVGSPAVLGLFPHYDPTPWLWLAALVAAVALLAGIRPAGEGFRRT